MGVPRRGTAGYRAYMKNVLSQHETMIKEDAGQYSEKEDYPKNFPVFKDKALWFSNDDIPKGTPFVEGNTGKTWQRYCSDSPLAPWSSERVYRKHYPCTYAGVLKLCVVDYSTKGVYKPEEWLSVDSQRTSQIKAEAYSQSKAYGQYHAVTKDGDLLMSVTTIKPNQPFDPSMWLNLSSMARINLKRMKHIPRLKSVNQDVRKVAEAIVFSPPTFTPPRFAAMKLLHNGDRMYFAAGTRSPADWLEAPLTPVS